jgi:hypothetical protein
VKIIVPVILAGIFIQIGNCIYYHYTQMSPDLVYETFPPALFPRDAQPIAIHSARLENAGNKEAEEVQVYFELPASCAIQEIKVEPSPKSIPYSVGPSINENSKQLTIPLLNPGEKVCINFLVQQANTVDMAIQVRGKGQSGHPKAIQRDGLSPWIIVLGVIVGAVIATFAGRFIFRRYLETRLRILDKDVMRLSLTLTGVPPKEKLVEVLLGRRYRLFYNPEVPGLSKTKIIRFGDTGAITEGSNRNEANWRIKNGFLEILNADGKVHSRFYYNPSDSRFYHTNDQDTLSIKHQYIVPEESD